MKENLSHLVGIFQLLGNTTLRCQKKGEKIIYVMQLSHFKTVLKGRGSAMFTAALTIISKMWKPTSWDIHIYQ